MNNNYMRALGGLLISAQLFGCGSKSTADHIAEAKQYLADAEARSAVIELKSALQADVESAEARWLLGEAYLAMGNLESAEKEFRRALSLGWPQAEVLPSLAESLLGLQKYAAIRELPASGLEGEAAARLLATRARAEIAQGEFEAATARVTEALTADPDNADVRRAQAQLLQARGDTNGARSLLDKLIEQDPDDWRAWSLLGQVYLMQDAQQAALEAFDRALSIQPTAFSERFQRGLVRVQLGELEGAQEDADRLLQRAPQHPAGNYLQGVIYFQSNNYQEAVNSLSAATPAAATYPLALLLLGISHEQLGNHDQAISFAESFHNAVPDSTAGRKFLATLRLNKRRFDEVIDLIEPVVASHPDDVDAINLLANGMLATGESERGIELLNQAVALRPDSPAARVRLGASLMATGHKSDANRELNAALELDPQFQQADLLLILNHLANQQFDAALTAAEAFRQRNPAAVTPYNVIARIHITAGQPEEAKKALEQAISLKPDDPTANHNLARLALAEGDRESALGYYKRVLESRPDHLATLLHVANLMRANGDKQQYVNYLQRAIQAQPSALQPRVLLAQYHIAQGKPERVAPLFATLGEIQKDSPRVLVTLAQAQLASGQFDAANYSLDQLEQAEDSAVLHYLRAMVLARQENPDATRSELAAAMALDPDFVPARIALARLALGEGDDAAFTQHLDHLVKLAPENAEVLTLRAARARRQGDLERATEFARRAFDVTPSSMTADNLANYYEQGGEPEAALALRQTWARKNPKDPAAHMSLGDQLQRMQRTDAAQEQYLVVVELQPDNTNALNNIAWNMRLDDPARAMEYALRAATLAPASPAVLDTLAVTEYLNGLYLRAYNNVLKALSKWPDHPSLRYHKAMIAAKLRRPEEAIAILEALQGEQRNFAEREEASSLLARLRGAQAGN